MTGEKIVKGYESKGVDMWLYLHIDDFRLKIDLCVTGASEKAVAYIQAKRPEIGRYLLDTKRIKIDITVDPLDIIAMALEKGLYEVVVIDMKEPEAITEKETRYEASASPAAEAEDTPPGEPQSQQKSND